MAKLTFRTIGQAVLFTHELRGQISDGHWENLNKKDHYVPWFKCEVAVGIPVGRDFDVRYDGYNFTSKTFLEVIWRRMLGQVRVALAYGTETVETLSCLFNWDGWDGLPTYKDYGGRTFWDDKRAAVLAVCTRLGITLEDVKAVVESDVVYDRKALLADLREMKATIRTRL
jgi:hypothetical protein